VTILLDNGDEFGVPAQKTRVRITVRGRSPSWRRPLLSDPREQMRKSGRAAGQLQKARAL
jgi:hypothetical protein